MSCIDAYHSSSIFSFLPVEVFHSVLALVIVVMRWPIYPFHVLFPFLSSNLYFVIVAIYRCFSLCSFHSVFVFLSASTDLSAYFFPCHSVLFYFFKIKHFLSLIYILLHPIILWTRQDSPINVRALGIVQIDPLTLIIPPLLIVEIEPLIHHHREIHTPIWPSACNYPISGVVRRWQSAIDHTLKNRSF